MSQSIPSSPFTSRPSSTYFPRTQSYQDEHARQSIPARVFERVRRIRRSRSFAPDDHDSSDEANVRRKKKMYDNQALQEDSTLMGGNGIRVWYESYTTIDWLHDDIKESSRLRRIRGRRGVSGLLINTWDRLQGWLIVTLTGLISAVIAAGIIESEAVLFDLKEGYCQRDWKLAKRFCCPYAGAPDWDGDSNISIAQHAHRGLLAAWAGPVAASPKWKKLTQEGTCSDWITWGDRFALKGESNWIADYGMYVGIAVLLASTASIMTVYLTSSELYISTKNTYTKEGGNPGHVGGQQEMPTSGSDETSPLLRSGTLQSKYLSTAIPPKYIKSLATEQRQSVAIPSRKVLYFAAGSGISEVKSILCGFVIHGYLGFWTLLTKAVGLALSVASGLSLGKEGPFVHIASCVGNIVCRLFSKYEHNESKKREMLSCACAAGVAVAFAAPVGGVLFSLEEVSYYFPAKVMFRSFFCAMVAAATLRFLDPYGTGKIVLFQVTYDRDWHWLELIFFIIIGLFGGLYGALFTRLNVIWSTKVRSKTWMAKYPIYEVIMITVISVVVSFLNDYTRMSGPELIADLFSECHEHESLDGLCISTASEIWPLLKAILFTMIAKGLLTIVTFGIKLPAGIFIPTLAVGACFGHIVGLMVQYAHWSNPQSSFFDWCPNDNSACIVPGLYAMVGAAATLSGVTRTTVSLVVIMFELTGTLNYAVPVMLAVLVAKTVADALEHKGIYDLVLDFCGLPYLDAKDKHTWRGVTILDAVDTGVETISLEQENTVETLHMKLMRLAHGLGDADGGFPLLVHERGTPQGARAPHWRLVGYLAAQELEHALKKVNLTYPDTNPSRLVCTFAHVSRGDEGEEESGSTMRDSALWTSDDPSDLSVYVDRAPVSVHTSTSLELVHQMFVKLGVRYVVVLNIDGTFKGVIFKKRWLAFLSTLQH